MSTRMTISKAVRRALLASTATAATLAHPTAFAAEESLETIVVTGSMIRRTDAEAPSPITVISAASLEERGITTIAEALQRVSANNAGTIPQGWNSGNNFASGANAPALRGLTVQATLSIADGLRIAPYPLADDGQRNFVDLNTIPSAIVERVEVLRDGASSSYGADAIAGVVNVITKKEIQGLHLGGSAGLSEAGGGDDQRIDMTWGMGSLSSDGYNFYVSAEYQTQDDLFARDRGYPFNSTDWSGVCGPSGSCMRNLNHNGVTPELGDIPQSFNGLRAIPGVALVRPVAGTAPTGAGRYQFLNAAAGCREWPTTTISPAQSATSPLRVCEVDIANAFQMLQPEVERGGVSARFTANIGEQAQFYAMANVYRTDSFASLLPQPFNGSLPAPNPAGLPAANVILPVFVCAQGVGTFDGLGTGCDASNGSLNPHNPFAADGRRAEVLLRSPFTREVNTSSRARRVVFGLEGGFGTGWNYTASLTGSDVALTRDQNNYPIPERIWTAAARGQFNFSDPYANSQEVWDFVAPRNSRVSESELWQVQGTVGKEILMLPGGALQAAVGTAYREESIDAPSANPGNSANPFSRHFGINAVGTAGERDVKSAFFEVSAPVLQQVELQASGRYDEYSTGQSSFSPKLGFKVTPIEQIAVRGTWSQGFRIPSFNEAFGLPTTGFVSRNVNCTQFAAFCAAHGNNAYATNAYNLGLTQTGNPQLDPEESESFTAGLVFAPMRNLSFTLDYWRIDVDNLITGVTSTAAVEAAYYSNNGVVNIPGFNVVPGTPDPAFPNALPTLGFIETSFANQDSQTVSGVDFGASLTMPIGPVTLSSNVEVSYLAKYEIQTDAGDVLEYEGTLSPCNITSCSGAPQWRGSWQNTVQFDNGFGHTAVSLTTYFTSGYDTASIDFGGVEGECQANAADHVSTQAFVDGTPVNCKADEVWNVDLTIRHQINDTYTVFADVLNVLDIEPDFDPSAAYGIFGFNPAWGGPNMLGRFYRVGVKVDF